MILSYYFILILNVLWPSFGHTFFVETRWQVTSYSKLEILGSTNINEFHCLSMDYEGKDIMKEVVESGEPALYGEIIMKSTGFDCRNSMMTKDFAKTVKADAFPEIKIRFIGLSADANGDSNRELSGKVAIDLAGKLKTYTVSCSIIEENSYRKYIEGNRIIRFSDFNLQPPKKLFGAVNVRDSLNVNFQLNLLKIES